MSRTNNIIKEISELNTYEKTRILEFLKSNLLTSGIISSVSDEVAENKFSMGKVCPFCGQDKISKHGKYHGKTGIKQRYKCQNQHCYSFLLAT